MLALYRNGGNGPMRLVERNTKELPGYLGGPFQSIIVQVGSSAKADDLVNRLTEIFVDSPVPIYVAADGSNVMIIMPDPEYTEWRLRQENGYLMQLAGLVLPRWV